MKYCLTVMSIFIALTTVGQSLSSSQQKTLNDAIEFLNKGSKEISGSIDGVMDVYTSVNRYKEDSRSFVKAYKCNVELQDYYYKEALSGAATLGTQAKNFTSSLNSVMKSYEDAQKTCQSLEVYFRLQDYKGDDYKKFYELIEQYQRAVAGYAKVSESAWQSIHKIFTTLQPFQAGNPYHVAWKMMSDQVFVEKRVLDSWTINLNGDIHTGWPVEMLKKQVLEDDKLIAALEQKLPEVKYPASSQIGVFKGGLKSIQDSKRKGIDEYTYENQKSDHHSNEVHRYIQGYYNGVLIPHFNMFIKYASQDGFRGIYLPDYTTVFEIKTSEVSLDLTVERFKDIPHSPVAISKSSSMISDNEFKSLSLYIDFVNECVRQFKNSMPSLHNLNSSAINARRALQEGRNPNLTFYDKDFEVPLTLYQQAIESVKFLPPAYQESLKSQAGVLHSILNEWSQWSSVLLNASETKTLARDSAELAFQAIERYQEIVNAFDRRKEQLYEDVRSIYESYQPQDPTNSWSKSGMALLELADLDKEQLYVARSFYTSNPEAKVNTAKIDDALRQVITDEYSNMKGIQKFGRSNGRCPYTPYEDVPVTSRNFSENLNKLGPSELKGRNHPYSRLVYLYNDVVDDYNKFCELSKEMKLLQHVKQLELFEVEYPDPSRIRRPRPTVPKTDISRKQNEEEPKVKKEETQEVVSSQRIQRDTIYIERHDTIFMRESPEKLRSMEGYATNNMVLLLDVSGSMNSSEKLPLLKTTLLNMLDMMREEDEVSVVVYSGKAKVLLQPISFTQQDNIRRVIGSLKSSGKTDANAGLKLAYQVADKNYIRGGNNRIILATDGEFPISEESTDLIERFAGEDIFISVFNFGKGMGAARNLEKLARLGKGNYEMITPENAEFMLIQEAKSKRRK